MKGKQGQCNEEKPMPWIGETAQVEDCQADPARNNKNRMVNLGTFHTDTHRGGHSDSGIRLDIAHIIDIEHPHAEATHRDSWKQHQQ